MAASRSHLCLIVLQLAAALMAVSMVVVADPDITTDYVLPPNKTSVDATFFTYEGLRNGVSITGNGFGASKVTQEQLLSLTGLGVSTALLNYEANGLNSPHIHPRGTEVLLVLQGNLTVGLIDSANKFFGTQLYAGDIFVFPKGLVHYQWNSADQPVMAYAAFSSANPGTVSVPKTIFGTKIEDAVLEKAFQVSADVIHQLQAPFVPVPPPASEPEAPPAPGIPLPPPASEPESPPAPGIPLPPPASEPESPPAPAIPLPSPASAPEAPPSP